LIFFYSCIGQNPSINLKERADPISSSAQVGQVVSEMDSGLMIVFQDSRNQYWFGSKDQGVYRYDGKGITHLTKNDGLCSNRLRGIQEDRFGSIYFDTGEGISKFNGQTFTTLELDNDGADADWKLEPNDLWFEGYWGGNGPYRYDGKLLHHLEFPKHDLEDEFNTKYPNVSHSPYEVYKVYRDNMKIFGLVHQHLGRAVMMGNLIFGYRKGI
jgi:hypothetical protein